MSNRLQLLRNTQLTDITSYTPLLAEPIFDVKTKQLRIGDGTTPGGIVPSEMLTTDVISTNYTAHANELVLVDCSGGPINITLPTAPKSGQVVKILDITYSASTTNTITVIQESTSLINNVNENFIIDLPRTFISFVYIEATKNWLVDLGGIIFPSTTINLTEELMWTEDEKLGIKSVAVGKLDFTQPLDLGVF